MERLAAIGLGLLILGGLILFSIFEHNRGRKLRSDISTLLLKHEAATNEIVRLKSELLSHSSTLNHLRDAYRDAESELELLRASHTGNGTLPVYSQIPEFTLTSHLSETITDNSLRGQFWLADIIFTRCAGPCPVMTQTLADLQKKIPSEWPVKFVTLTTDPEFDTVPVLKEHAERHGADGKRWMFLTGDQKEINRLAIDGLKLTAIPKSQGDQENPNDLFIHATIFVLVDPEGRVRATFESDDKELLNKVRSTITRLRSEEAQ